MSSNRDDQFARIAALRPAPRRGAAQPRGFSPDLPADSDSLAQRLGAACERNRYGEFLVVRRWFEQPSSCEPYAPALRLLAATSPAPTPRILEEISDPQRWLFLDTETTGLAGGTGTYAFLVGVAWWDAGGLQVEQFFMRDHSEEHAVLLALAARLAERRVLVTFNGKSFDWPLLETRFRMTRSIAPAAPRAHLDLLHPARQLWRPRLRSVRLGDLEQRVLGWDRGPDVQSEMIPQIYFEFLRRGASEPLVPVFRHNQMDLRGLAALAGHMAELLSERGNVGDPLDLFGLSRLLHRRGEVNRARRLYEQALDAGLPAGVERVARRQLARLAKRERDYARAVPLWEQVLRSASVLTHQASDGLMPSPSRPAKYLSSANPARVGPFADNRRASVGDALPSGPDGPESLSQDFLEAYEQLAIYYEHRARQPARAAELARDALADLRKARQAGRIDSAHSRRWQARFDHRLARLIRKRKLHNLNAGHLCECS